MLSNASSSLLYYLLIGSTTAAVGCVRMALFCNPTHALCKFQARGWIIKCCFETVGLIQSAGILGKVNGTSTRKTRKETLSSFKPIIAQQIQSSSSWKRNNIDTKPAGLEANTKTKHGGSGSGEAQSKHPWTTEPQSAHDAVSSGREFVWRQWRWPGLKLLTEQMGKSSLCHLCHEWVRMGDKTRKALQ